MTASPTGTPNEERRNTVLAQGSRQSLVLMQSATTIGINTVAKKIKQKVPLTLFIIR